MSNNETQRELRNRIGISVAAPNAQTFIDIAVEAEAANVRQLWTTQGPSTVDSLTAFAAAFTHTNAIRLGTSIVPTYPRHPLALAQQASTAATLGPDRLRLGVGPSHRPVIEGTYGLKMDAPLEHLREYVAVLRAALWDGQVDHEGRFFTAKTKLNSTPKVPLLISALGEQAFHLAGEISDGAISWNCPLSYLRDQALPALQHGAQAANRPVPPLVAHMWVALSTDATAVREAARKSISSYGRLPFYANMFAAAGFPVGPGGSISDDLIDALVVMGDNAAIEARLRDALASGMDELLLTNVALGDPAADRTALFGLVGQIS